MCPLSPATPSADQRAVFAETLAYLRRTERLPLSVIGHGFTHWNAPGLDQIEIERAFEFRQASDLGAAMALAGEHVARGIYASARDPALRFTPQFVAITDARGGLALAGEVRAGGVLWCCPV